MIILAGWLLIGLAVLRYLSVRVPPRTGALVVNIFTGEERPIDSGWNIILPWEILSEKDISLGTNVCSRKISFDTKDEVVITLPITIYERADLRYLVRYCSFKDNEDRINGIFDELSSILWTKIRRLKDLDAVLDQINSIQESAKKKFELTESEDGRPLEQYFGTNLEKIVISDPEIPAAVKEAKDKAMAQEKENERRVLEMANLKKMASSLVLEASKHGQKLSYDVALRKIQIQLEKEGVKENFNTLGLEEGTQVLADKAIQSVLKEVFRAKRK